MGPAVYAPLSEPYLAFKSPTRRGGDYNAARWWLLYMAKLGMTFDVMTHLISLGKNAAELCQPVKIRAFTTIVR